MNEINEKTKLTKLGSDRAAANCYASLESWKRDNLVTTFFINDGNPYPWRATTSDHDMRYGTTELHACENLIRDKGLPNLA